MSYKLYEINARAVSDPKGFIDGCDAEYSQKIAAAAGQIADNMENSPIVLLSGPSGSGKTTTSKKLAEELERRGIRAYAIAMDDYYRSRDSYVTPMTADGKPDWESPECVDLDLLSEHFGRLERGERVFVPRFDFIHQKRVVRACDSLKLGKDEIAVFEGIHALNDRITDEHPDAFKLYVSARSNVEDDSGTVAFKGTWMRLVRRTVRDQLFRGADAASTIAMWANVRRGEKKYISPFKDKANLKLDSSFPYEVCVFKQMVSTIFDAIPEENERYWEIRQINSAYERFEGIDPELLNPDSLLREFIGGGIYE